MPIEWLPIKYQLQHNWSIPKKDLKYLKWGPLVDQDFNILIQYRTLFDEIGYKISIIKDIYIRFKFLIALIVIFLSIILLFWSNTYIDTIKWFLKILN
jgi:hypothetical protein